MGAKDDCPRALGKDMAPAPAWLPWIPIDLHQASLPRCADSNDSAGRLVVRQWAF